jgi:hypothetical protein
MTTPHAEAGERITEEWLKANRFAKLARDHWHNKLSKEPLVYIEVFFHRGDFRFYVNDQDESVFIGCNWNPSRLIKLIEALTGKEWQGK